MIRIYFFNFSFALDEMQIKLLRIYLFFTEMQEYIYIYSEF